MIREYLSNVLLDGIITLVLAVVIFAFVIGPRLNGRRTYNWVVRRVAKAVPGAKISTNGRWLRRSVVASWPAVIGPSDNSAMSQLKAVVSAAAPYYVVLMLAEGDEHYHLANFEWKQWALPIRDLVHYANLRALKRALTRAVTLHLALKARRSFPSAKAMAAQSNQGFLGLGLGDIVEG